MGASSVVTDLTVGSGVCTTSSSSSESSTTVEVWLSTTSSSSLSKSSSPAPASVAAPALVILAFSSALREIWHLPLRDSRGFTRLWKSFHVTPNLPFTTQIPPHWIIVAMFEPLVISCEIVTSLSSRGGYSWLWSTSYSSTFLNSPSQ